MEREERNKVEKYLLSTRVPETSRKTVVMEREMRGKKGNTIH